MSAEEALARLCLEPARLAHFLLEGEEAVKDWGLSPEDQAAYLGLDRMRVRLLAAEVQRRQALQPGFWGRLFFGRRP